MNMNTDYIRGARGFVITTDEGVVDCRVLAAADVPPMGGEFVIYTTGQTNEDGVEEVCAAKAVDMQGTMIAVSGTQEWMTIDGMMADLQAEGRELYLRTDDLEYFQVRARRYGYESAEQWLLAAIFGEDCAREDDRNDHEG